MKRKEFLGWSLSAAGLFVLGMPGCVAAGGKKKNNPVGAHVWVYARDQPEYDVSGILPQIFSDMKYAGLDGVELMEQPLRKEETVQRIAELIDRGIVLNLHNHTYEVENNMFDLKGTLQRIPGIGLGPDLNWLLRADIDPIWFLNEYQNNIVFLHLRDQLESGKWPEALGEGDVDFGVIGNTIREIGFQGDIIIELAYESGFNGIRPIRESLKMSREYLKEAAGI